MNTVTTKSQNLSRDIMNGNNQMVMMHASIRENRGLNISIEMLDPGYAEANRDEVAESVYDFILEAQMLADQQGIPAMTRDAPNGTNETE